MGSRAPHKVDSAPRVLGVRDLGAPLKAVSEVFLIFRKLSSRTCYCQFRRAQNKSPKYESVRANLYTYIYIYVYCRFWTGLGQFIPHKLTIFGRDTGWIWKPKHPTTNDPQTHATPTRNLKKQPHHFSGIPPLSFLVFLFSPFLFIYLFYHRLFLVLSPSLPSQPISRHET